MLHLPLDLPMLFDPFLLPKPMSAPKCVVFDCDGVLTPCTNSWRIVHDFFGTNNTAYLPQLIAGTLSDAELTRLDIRTWKAACPSASYSDLATAFADVALMKGALALVQDLQATGCEVAIVSAGIDMWVERIAGLLGVTRWTANGLTFADDGMMLDEGVVRVLAAGKGAAVEAVLRDSGLAACDCVCVGDSEMDLSMHVPGTRFIGFNPSRDTSVRAFEEAGVPVVMGQDLGLLRPLLGLAVEDGA